MTANNKGRIGGLFVPLLKATLASPAWLETAHGARSLYVALRGRLLNDLSNNGRVFLSKLNACKEIGSSDEQVVRWFKELQHYGFIVMTSAGRQSSDGNGMSPHWRLTEISSPDGNGGLLPPTRDFLRWDGSPFNPTTFKNIIPFPEGAPDFRTVSGPRFPHRKRTRNSAP